MDSTEKSSTRPSKRKSEAKISAMVKSKRKKFFDFYFRQNFSLPSDSIIYYIAKNPRTSFLYEKMIKTCKYFFIKNPILVISQFAYSGDSKWEVLFESRPFDLLKITSKIWITQRFNVHPKIFVHKNSVNQNILSSLMPKLYQCNVKYVSISSQIISFLHLFHLISSATEIYFNNVTVKDKNGLNVGIEKIVEVAVKAKVIQIQPLTNLITSETMKELSKLPHFSKFVGLRLYGIPESFDLDTFFNYIKKNKTTTFILDFDDSISEAYKIRLEKIVDEILATENRDYKTPLIRFAGFDSNKYYKLL